MFKNFQGHHRKISVDLKKKKKSSQLKKKYLLTNSSDPSGQSVSPSQRHLAVIQRLSAHIKSVTDEQFVFGQLISSLISPQSSSLSQRQRFCMHRPLLHVNSSERHVSSIFRKKLLLEKVFKELKKKKMIMKK